LFNYLIKFAYSLDEQDNDNKPPYEYEWQYKDIAQIKNKKLCSEFERACPDELEAL